MAQPGGARPRGPQPLLAVCRWAFQAACWLSSAHQLRFMALVAAQAAGPLLDVAAPESCGSCCTTGRGPMAVVACSMLYLFFGNLPVPPFLQMAPCVTTATMEFAGELIAADLDLRNAEIVQLPNAVCRVVAV